jgi:hypothetical protein
MLEERSGLNWVELGYEPLDDAFRNLTSEEGTVRAEAAQRLFDSHVQDDKRYLVRSYVVIRYIHLLSHPRTDKFDLISTLAQLSHKDPEISEQDNHRIQSLMANNDAAFTPFLNMESMRDYVLEIIGNLHHYADRFVPLMFTSFSHDDPAAVYTMARLIHKDIPDVETYLSFFQANLTSPNASIRSASALAVAKLMQKSAPRVTDDIFLEAMRYDSVHSLADSLKPLGDERAVQALYRHLEHEKDRDRLFTLLLYLLSWSFGGFPNKPQYAMVPPFFRPKSHQDKSTLAILRLLLRGWLLDKLPGLRNVFFRTSNARAKYAYFVDSSENETDVPVPRREKLTEAQSNLIKQLLGLPQIWQYESNVFELFGLPTTRGEIKRLLR